MPLRRIEDLPGPRPWPVVGNALQFKMARLHLDIEALCREHGAFLKVRLLGTHLLIVSDPQAIQAIFRDRPEGFRRAAQMAQVASEMWETPGLFLAEGEAWRRQRLLVMAAMAPQHVRAYFPSLRAVAERLDQRWRRAAAKGASIDLQADLKRFTFDAIARLAFGSEVDSLGDDDHVMHGHLDRLLAGVYRRSLAPFPYWRYITLPVDRALQDSVEAVRQALTGFVADARAAMAAQPALRTSPANVLQAMIAAADQPGSGLTDLDVQGQVADLLLAGEDTSANTLAWLIDLLWRHPGALRQASDEVRRTLPESLSELTLEQLNELPFIEACVHEAMRLKPVAPFLLVEAVGDKVVGDIAVPAGTQVCCVLRHHTLSGEYFPDPQAFDPQRWLPETPTTASAAARKANMPFGGGARICPGRYLALLEMKLAMATLLRGFDIQAIETPDGQPTQEVMGFTMNPVGLRMRVRSAAGLAGVSPP